MPEHKVLQPAQAGELLENETTSPGEKSPVLQGSKDGRERTTPGEESWAAWEELLQDLSLDLAGVLVKEHPVLGVHCRGPGGCFEDVLEGRGCMRGACSYPEARLEDACRGDRTRTWRQKERRIRGIRCRKKGRWKVRSRRPCSCRQVGGRKGRIHPYLLQTRLPFALHSFLPFARHEFL